MTIRMDHYTEIPQLSFPFATTDNTVDYVSSCNYTSITNTCLSWHRGGCWKQTGMKMLEDVEFYEPCQLVLCTSYLNLHCVAHLSSSLCLSCWNTAHIETLECSHPEDALIQGTRLYLMQRPKLHSSKIKPVIYNVSSIKLKLHSCTMPFHYSYISHR